MGDKEKNKDPRLRQVLLNAGPPCDGQSGKTLEPQ